MQPPAPPRPRGRRLRALVVARLLVASSLVCGALTLQQEPLLAQDQGSTVEILVTDSLGQPLHGARISLDRLAITALTDSVGMLRLLQVSPGPLGVVVDQFGFLSDSTVLNVRPGRTHRAEFRLKTEVIEVGELRVNVRRRDQLDFLRGFHERRDRGLGYFLTRSEIEERGIANLGNLLHTVPGLRSSPMQFGQSNVRATRTPVTRRCEIAVYLDGMRYRNPSDLAGLPTLDIQGIEVYRGRSELPAEFADIDTNCGAIVVWSRRFREPLQR